jgi:hypothetical protein
VILIFIFVGLGIASSLFMLTFLKEMVREIRQLKPRRVPATAEQRRREVVLVNPSLTQHLDRAA